MEYSKKTNLSKEKVEDTVLHFFFSKFILYFSGFASDFVLMKFKIILAAYLLGFGDVTSFVKY